MFLWIFAALVEPLPQRLTANVRAQTRQSKSRATVQAIDPGQKRNNSNDLPVIKVKNWLISRSGRFEAGFVSDGLSRPAFGYSWRLPLSGEVTYNPGRNIQALPRKR
jgi:hypothetical protein